MFRIDDATAATSLPAPEAAGSEGYFTEGNPTTGVPATNVRGSWLNMIQEELRAIVVAAGLTPSKTTYNQVLSAIKRIGQNTLVLADTGVANAYAAVNATPLVAGTWVDGVVQAVKIAHANTGASTYAPDGLSAIPIYGLGLQPLQGGELTLNGTALLMRTTIAGVNSGSPIAVLMECFGGAQQCGPGTQSQHAVNLGQFASLLGAAGYIKIPTPNGNLILQWGPVASTVGNGVTFFSFPIAFPNAVYSLLVTGGATAPQTTAATLQGNVSSLSSGAAYNWGSSTIPQGSFLVIGK